MNIFQYTNECIPIKLYLQKQANRQIWNMGYSLPTSGLDNQQNSKSSFDLQFANSWGKTTPTFQLDITLGNISEDNISGTPWYFYNTDIIRYK